MESLQMSALMAVMLAREVRVVADILRDHKEVGVAGTVLLAVALELACIALAIPAHFAVIAVLPALGCVVAMLAAFRIMG